MFEAKADHVISRQPAARKKQASSETGKCSPLNALRVPAIRSNTPLFRLLYWPRLLTNASSIPLVDSSSVPLDLLICNAAHSIVLEFVWAVDFAAPPCYKVAYTLPSRVNLKHTMASRGTLLQAARPPRSSTSLMYVSLEHYRSGSVCRQLGLCQVTCHSHGGASPKTCYDLDVLLTLRIIAHWIRR